MHTKKQMSSKSFPLYVLLAGSIITALTGTTQAATRQAVGQVIAIEGHAEARSDDGAIRQLRLRAPVFSGDTITTGPKSKLQVFLADDTTISQGQQSVMVIDNYIFDSQNDEGSGVLRFVRGVFRSVTGRITEVNPERFQIRTGRAVIGVRGCDLIIQVMPESESIYVVELPSGRSIEIDLGLRPRRGRRSASINRAGRMVHLTDAGISRQRRFRGPALDRLIDATTPAAQDEEEEGDEPLQPQPPPDEDAVEDEDADPEPDPEPDIEEDDPDGADEPDGQPEDEDARQPDQEPADDDPAGDPGVEYQEEPAEDPLDNENLFFADSHTDPDVVMDDDDQPARVSDVLDEDIVSEPDLAPPDDEPPPPDDLAPPPDDLAPPPDDEPPLQPVERLIAKGMNWEWGFWEYEHNEPRGVYWRGDYLSDTHIADIIAGSVEYRLHGTGTAGALLMNVGQVADQMHGLVDFSVRIGGNTSEAKWNGAFSLSGRNSRLDFNADGTIGAGNNLRGQATTYLLRHGNETYGIHTLEFNHVDGRLVGSGAQPPIQGVVGGFEFIHESGPHIQGAYGADLHDASD